jgi:hypothetical protein
MPARTYFFCRLGWGLGTGWPLWHGAVVGLNLLLGIEEWDSFEIEFLRAEAAG